MNSKNWGDKADKDLFFMILSVKNIGVISGSEWTTIGGHMRSLGYGFTNEGCRQHFQGLRRAQQKADGSGPVGENPRKVDPTLNPITRRPGPGRGRPRKSGAADSTENGTPEQSQQSQSQPPEDSQPPQLPQPPQPLQPLQPPQLPLDPNMGPAPTPMMESGPPPSQIPDAQHDIMQPVELDLETQSEEPDEHLAKRPRLEENQDPALNDEAILSALVSHNNTGAIHDSYGAEFYGEA